MCACLGKATTTTNDKKKKKSGTKKKAASLRLQLQSRNQAQRTRIALWDHLCRCKPLLPNSQHLGDDYDQLVAKGNNHQEQEQLLDIDKQGYNAALLVDMLSSSSSLQTSENKKKKTNGLEGVLCPEAFADMHDMITSVILFNCKSDPVRHIFYKVKPTKVKFF